MNRADPIRTFRSVPADVSTAGISLRHYSVEVAGPACYGGMKIMNCLFIMGPMALDAFPISLVAVPEPRSLRVAGQTVDILVGS